MLKIVLSSLFLLLLCGFASAASSPPLEVVPKVDLTRYVGRWYEIASFPQWFQKGCTDSQAEYRLRDDGKIGVVNICVRKGKMDKVKGTAKVVDPATNAKLKVSFFWPIRGDYWIIELGRDYEYAVVSTPSMKYLWILSRTPQMEQQCYQEIVGRLKDRGFRPHEAQADAAEVTALSSVCSIGLLDSLQGDVKF